MVNDNILLVIGIALALIFMITTTVLLITAILTVRKLRKAIKEYSEVTSKSFYQTQQLISGQIRKTESDIMKHLDPNYME